MKKQAKLIAIFAGFALLAHLPWLVQGSLFTNNDMIQQQLPFYLDGWEKFHQGSLPMWGFNNLIGVNYLGANSFYFAFSPFFWLSLLFPKAWLPAVMLGLNVLKLALAGTTMSWFLQKLGVKSFWLLVLGGVSYAFSGPLIMDYWFNHFNDFLCLVPLFFIAMEWVIQKQRYWPMALAVAGAAMINVYFCLGLSLLSFGYFLIRTAIIASRTYYFAWGEWIGQIFRYLAMYALGIGIAAFAFIPTVTVLLSNPRLGDSLAKTPTVMQMLSNWLYLWQSLLLPPVTMKIHPFLQQVPLGRSGTWQSLTAAVTPILLLAWFQIGQVWHKRTCWLVIICLAGGFAVFTWPLTNQILAGLSNITFRNLYLISFFVISFAIVTFERLQKPKVSRVLLGTGVVIGGLFISVIVAWLQLPAEQPVIDTFWRVSSFSVLPVVIVTALSALIFVIGSKRHWQWLAILAGCFGCFQFGYFIYWSGNQQPSFVAASTVEQIMERTQAYERVQAEIGTDEILWRYASDFTNEKTDYFAYNQGLAYQLNTPHIYHSLYQTTTQELFNFLHGIEQQADAYWQRYWVRSFKYNRLTHWLLGVKYTLLSNQTQQALPTTEYIGPSEVGEVYELPSQFAKTYAYQIPEAEMTNVPFVLRDLVANLAFLGPTTPQLQTLPTYPWEADVQAATAQIEAAVATSQNISLQQNVLTVAANGLLNLPFAQQTGELYVSHLEGMSVYIDGQLYDTKNDTSHYMQAKTLAIPVVETTKSVTLQLPAGYYPLWQNTPQGFQLFFADAAQFEPMRVQESAPVYRGNEWQQQVTLPQTQTLVFPVAFDRGWSVQIDDQPKQPVVSIQGGLIGVEVPAGTHELHFTYVTPGLIVGASVSVISVMSLLGATVWQKKRYEKKRGGYRW